MPDNTTDGDHQTQDAVAPARPKMMRRRSGEPVVVVNEGDGVLRFYKLTIVPTTPRRDPLAWLEEERCAVFAALAPIVGHDALADLFANFDAVFASLKQERS
jgi:hypothetical protein